MAAIIGGVEEIILAVVPAAGGMKKGRMYSVLGDGTKIITRIEGAGADGNATGMTLLEAEIGMLLPCNEKRSSRVVLVELMMKLTSVGAGR